MLRARMPPDPESTRDALPAPNASVAFVPASEVAPVVARARAAQPAWAALSIEARVQRLRKVKDRLLARVEALAAEVHRETGKPEVEAIVAECLPAADVIDYWATNIEELLVATELEIDRLDYPGKVGWTYRDPCGVVGLITPWNYPVGIPMRTLVPALLAGNAVVWKPSEVAPGSAKLVGDLFLDLVPVGVVEVVQGGGDAGLALAEADVDLVVCVGSVETGRAVGKACAERVSPCVLQLGGKDAAIVLADANLDRAAHGVVWGSLVNAGQSCAAIERVYVVASVADAFVEKVKAEVASLRRGVELGPMATERGRERVATQVAAAAEAGGKVVQGGATDERFIAPIVVRVDPDASPLLEGETFGPVIPVATVKTPEEAVARANASRYGLTASVWSRDIDAAETLAQKLHVGVVTINNHGLPAALPGAPWSGRGQTGSGVTGSPLSLDTLTRPRFVLTDRSRRKRELWWYPYTPAFRRMLLALAVLRSGGTGIFAKVAALFAVIGAFTKRFAKQSDQAR
jgi:acyl-CoA reductase-like NAD-dependent aldehyde dehydrogenase